MSDAMIGVLGGIVGAIVGAIASYAFTKRQTAAAEAFQVLREVNGLVSQLRWCEPAEVIRTKTLEYLRLMRDGAQRPTGDSGVTLYLNFLDLVELIGLAYAMRALDRRIVRRSLKPLLCHPTTVPVSFLEELRETTKVAADYEYVEYLVRELGKESWLARVWRRSPTQSSSATTSSPPTTDAGPREQCSLARSPTPASSGAESLTEEPTAD